jgi:hypothetical protein
MKKEIDGQSYDTEASELMGETGSVGISRDEFGWWSERLYCTKEGEWFILTESGPMTRFARGDAVDHRYRENWRVVSKDEAVVWLKEHGCITEGEKDSVEELREN